MKNNKDVDSLSHTTWRCQYHVVFAPKYRRMVIYGQIKKDIGQILRKLCEQKDIEIIEAEACPDHIHMLISFSPKYSISYVMGYLKGKSSLMIFDRHANLKYKYGNRHFWARGYFVDAKESRLCKPCAETPLIRANVQTVCRKCAVAFLHKKERQILRFDVQYLVHLQGLEPWAHWLRVSCSTNWARGAYCRDAVSNIPTFESATTYFHAPFPANYLGHEWA